MNLQKMLLIALLVSAVSATTMPTLAKVIGFGHTAAYAAGSGGQGNQGEDLGEDQDQDQNGQH
jgi:hypothetical protein